MSTTLSDDPSWSVEKLISELIRAYKEEVQGPGVEPDQR